MITDFIQLLLQGRLWSLSIMDYTHVISINPCRSSYHFFRKEVANGRLKVLAIKSEDQHADILTKPVDEPTLITHRKAIMGW